MPRCATTLMTPLRIFGFIRHSLTTLILIALVHTAAIAQTDVAQTDASEQPSPQDRAQQALENGDLELALTIYTRHAYAGQAWAQIILAQINQNGRLVEPSIANAVDWYGRAAAAGSAEAQFRLGLIFCDAENKNSNRPAKCIDWLQRAASSKHPGALYQLAIFAYQGRYINSDLASTRTLASQALDGGVAEAKTLLTQIDKDLKSFDKKATVLTAETIAAEYNPNKYTVRLAIFKNQAQLERYALQSTLKKLYAYHAGNAWVLSHGSFASQEKAQAAITKLDESIRKLEPQTLSWSQILSNLQNSPQ